MILLGFGVFIRLNICWLVVFKFVLNIFCGEFGFLVFIGFNEDGGLNCILFVFDKWGGDEGEFMVLEFLNDKLLFILEFCGGLLIVFLNEEM